MTCCQFAVNLLKYPLAVSGTRLILFTPGLRYVHVLTFANPEVDGMHRVASSNLTKYDGTCTDVDTCADKVAVSFARDDDVLRGTVYVFKTFNDSQTELELLHEIDGMYHVTPVRTIVTRLAHLPIAGLSAKAPGLPRERVLL